MDSRKKTLDLIKRITERQAGPSQGTSEIDAALTLEDLHLVEQRLGDRIRKTLNALTGKDKGTATSIENAKNNQYLMKRLQARAILMRLHQKVMHSLLAAVPYKRRISRAKKGELSDILLGGALVGSFPF